MSLRSWLSSFKFPAVLAMAALGAGCSNYHYKGYQGDWQPELMVPYDLSKGTADAPVVYFATTRYRALGVKFHRRCWPLMWMASCSKVQDAARF